MPPRCLSQTLYRLNSLLNVLAKETPVFQRLEAGKDDWGLNRAQTEQNSDRSASALLLCRNLCKDWTGIALNWETFYDKYTQIVLVYLLFNSNLFQILRSPTNTYERGVVDSLLASGGSEVVYESERLQPQPGTRCQRSETPSPWCCVISVQMCEWLKPQAEQWKLKKVWMAVTARWALT